MSYHSISCDNLPPLGIMYEDFAPVSTQCRKDSFREALAAIRNGANFNLPFKPAATQAANDSFGSFFGSQRTFELVKCKEKTHVGRQALENWESETQGAGTWSLKVSALFSFFVTRHRAFVSRPTFSSPPPGIYPNVQRQGHYQASSRDREGSSSGSSLSWERPSAPDDHRPTP